MWSSSDVVGLFLNNVGPFSSNVVPGGRLFSINLVPEQPMFLGQAIYVLGPLHLMGLIFKATCNEEKPKSWTGNVFTVFNPVLASIEELVATQ
jgi:hypothetical protein